MNRFFTADWHLFSESVRKLGDRPYADIFAMNKALIRNANQRTHCTYKEMSVKDVNGNNVAIKVPIKEDVIYHLGDFYKYDSQFKVKPDEILSHINSKVILLEGNHDKNNRVKILANALTMDIGPFKNVTLSHYPSYYEESKFLNIPNHSIHICGHVHKLYKWAYDKYRDVLNINVGVDVWNYRIVSERELITYITFILQRLDNSFITENINTTCHKDFVLTNNTIEPKNLEKEKDNGKRKARKFKLGIQDKQQEMLSLYLQAREKVLKQEVTEL